MRTSLLLLLCSATLMACFPPPPPDEGNTPPTPVTPDAASGNTDAFDAATFANAIQPLFDGGGCIGGCHNTTSKFGNFGLHVTPAAGSAQMEENRLATVARVDLGLVPEAATTTKLYARATDMHSPTPITDTAAQETLRDWIAVGLMGQ